MSGLPGEKRKGRRSPVARGLRLGVAAAVAALLSTALAPAGRADDAEDVIVAERLIVPEDVTIDQRLIGFEAAARGDLAVLPSLADSEAGASAGAVYVLRRGGGGFVIEDKLLGSEAGDRLGRSVDVGDDVVVAGAPFAAGGGKAMVFTYDGTSWSSGVVLTQPPPADEFLAAEFGDGVAADGDTLIISNPRDDVDGQNAGAVFVYRRIGGGPFTFDHRLTPPEAGRQLLGEKLALDGDTLLTYSLGPASTPNSGIVDVFRDVGGRFVHEQTLSPDDGPLPRDYGFNLAVQGDVAVVPNSNGIMGANGVGSVDVYRRKGTTWTREQRIEPQQASPGRHFGSDVAIDGRRIVVGARLDDDLGEAAGAFHVFERFGSTWREICELQASDTAAGDNLGLGIAATGDFVLVAAPYRTVEGVGPVGSLYEFEIPLSAPPPADEGFLHAVKIRGKGKAGRGKLAVRGALDVGADPLDLAQPLSIFIDDTEVRFADGLTGRGRRFRGKQDGLKLVVKRSSRGSSAAQLKLLFREWEHGKGSRNLTLRIVQGEREISTTVSLVKGKFRRGKPGHAVSGPDVALTRFKSRGIGDGTFDLQLDLSVPTDGTGELPSATDLGVRVGDETFTIAAADLVEPAGRPRRVFEAELAATGITFLEFDPLLGRVRVHIDGVAIDASSGEPIPFAIGAGPIERNAAVNVLLAPRGSRLDY